MLIESVAQNIVLIDVNGQRAKGEAMDLEHGLQFLPTASIEYSDNLSACKDSDIVVIAAGANQKPGETRLDLLKKNSAIFKEIIPKIAKSAPKSIILVVSNPVDVMTRLTLDYSKFPSNRVIGSGTTLDSARLRFLLGKYFDLSPSSIHSYILGEHGDSSFPVWSSSSIAGLNICKHPDFKKSEMEKIIKQVKGSAYEIISAKGATYYAIGIAVSTLCRSILKDEKKVFPVSVKLKNYNGISDVCLSVPVVLAKEGAIKHLNHPFDKSEIVQLKNSAKILNDAYLQIK